jgi:nickel superoxide dismutase
MMKQSFNKTLFSLFIFTSLLSFAQLGHTHCQVPCGIYDDHARVQTMLENVTTIKMAIIQINDLSKEKSAQSKNINPLGNE